MRRSARSGLALSLVGVAVTAVLIATAPAASAAPARADGHRVTVMVHGFDREADISCAGAWNSAKKLLNANGWGDVVTFGYYNKATNCDLRLQGTTDTRIQEVGRQFAWTVYYLYSSHDVAIDVVTHSMGGLVAKAAIEGVNRYGVGKPPPDLSGLTVDPNNIGATKWPRDWPPFLYIEDMVTLATPHQGIGSAVVSACAITHEQCSDMRPGSGFLSWLGKQPASQMGTDYTFLASSHDDTVSSDSATNKRIAHHWALYGSDADGGTLSHTSIRNTSIGDWQASYGGDFSDEGEGAYPAPLRRMLEGLYDQRAQ
ncbi:esterase/lipase family protein [Nonomuraea insulae]|uniref:Esterase/lipase family protein n=1 Tax=Nonomuraea insulae TaxID=1616787 RepID=A0ABW1D7B2_9ACTN